MCLSPESFAAARVVDRLLAAGVDLPRAEAIGRKVARRIRHKRDLAYNRYLAGVEEGELLAVQKGPVRP